ncbi:MAG: hypothetical protein IPM71_04790 [Bacteroidota bacterium]|nr:MAG: hypothetical protein IPM71_04790 [Bacteroidota bacterium]
MYSGTLKTYFILSILMGAFFVFCSEAKAQSDTLQKNETLLTQETTTAEDDTAKKPRKHSPKIATFSSMLVPGLGQAYNQKYWKIPIIWGGGLALYSYYDYNNAYYHRFKLADEQVAEGLPVTDPDIQKLEDNPDAIEQYKNSFRRHRDRALIFAGLLYTANVVDALVDAHLLSYDISKDLSMQWQPAYIPLDPETYTQGVWGVNFQIRF